MLTTETIRLPEENLEKEILDIGLNNNSLSMTLKTQATEALINKYVSIQLKSFCTEKETICRIQRQPEKLDKTFASHIHDKA